VLGHDQRQRGRFLRCTSTLERLEALRSAMQELGGGGPCRVM
jgi:hypothetical protein